MVLVLALVFLVRWNVWAIVLKLRAALCRSKPSLSTAAAADLSVNATHGDDMKTYLLADQLRL